ncbi:MAG: TonB-dependent receptor [Acidobacteria bacterium]|nr:TonB-dependent receptor [Acidobacteriota bacterium]
MHTCLSKWIRAFTIAAALQVLAGPLFAQVTTGTIAGAVSDPDGRAVMGAAVRVVDPVRGNTASATTDDTGAFRVSLLPPATYQVSIAASGFADIARTVTVDVDSTVVIDVKVSLAVVQEQVDVAGRPPAVPMSSMGLGTVVDRARIEALPLNRRDFLQLALLAPGIGAPVESSELSSRGGVAMHANGAREESNDFLLDGVDNNDPYVKRYVVQPSVDSVQEFKVATNAYGAEYGRDAGGQVNVVTKSGTNRFEGFGYEYFRDRAMDARNYFEETGKQPFRRNQFGGGLGGPIVNGRTFFFGALDLLRENQGLSRLGVVPTDAARNGDFSGLGVSIRDPFTGLPFPGNVIPASRISPLARQMVSLFPSANRAGSPNYLGQPTQTDDRTQGTVRVDHRLGSADQLTLRYADGKANMLEPYTEGTDATAGFGSVVADRTWNIMAAHQHVFSGRIVNDLRFGGNGFKRDVLTENNATNVGALWGVNWLNVSPSSYGYPILNVAGYSKLGDAFTLPILRNAKTFQIVDALSIQAGRHFVKVGGEYRHIALDSKLDLFTRGQLSFTGAFSGNGLADLLLGLPTFDMQGQANNPIRMRTASTSLYAQDDWRLNPSLTLNLGVRYEYVTPPVDANDGMSTLDFTTGKLVQVGTNGVSRSGISPDRNNIAPRVGATWSVRPGTVVRGGYGVFYDSGMLTVNTAQYFNPPYFSLRVYTPGAQGLLSIQNPFPTTGGFAPPATLSILDPGMVTGYLQHWNVGVQREVPVLGSVTLAYAGSKGSNLIRPRDLNQPVPAAGDVQARRPNPAYSNIFYVESAGRSRYNSLQATVDRRLTRGVSLLASYTLSKSMDDASAFLGVPTDKNLPQDSRNTGGEWAPSSYDVRHRLTFSYILALPDGNPWTRNTQIQGITTMYSGQPFTPLLRFDNSNTGNSGGSTAASDRPNVTGDPTLSSPTPDQWFNTAAFSMPAKYTFGNAGRNSLRGPGFVSWDLGVNRRVPLHGRTALTLGVQVFNLFNRANFDMPGNYADEPATFGRILSAKAPRQAQLLARLAF